MIRLSSKNNRVNRDEYFIPILLFPVIDRRSACDDDVIHSAASRLFFIEEKKKKEN